MSNQPTNNTFADKIWQLFTSVKFTIVLLTLWLLGSVAGTLILQNATPPQYVKLYGTTWSNVFFRFGFFDVYHSTWYSLILLLLILNITACTLNTYKAKYALAFTQPKRRSVKGVGKLFLNYSFETENVSKHLDKLFKIISKRYVHTESFEEGSVKRIYAQKQPLAHFMVYFVHLSLILIILGGMITGFFGFEGIMEIPEKGEVDYVFKKTERGYVRESVPFSVRCDEFTFQKFESGMPKDYVSKLTIIENGKDVYSQRIEVNDPLAYKAYNFYQSTYRELAPLSIFDKKTNKTTNVNLPVGERQSLRDPAITLAVEALQSGKSNMMASVAWADMSGQVNRVMLSGNSEQDKQMQANNPYVITFSKPQPAYITGLLISSDPGVWLVWLGSFLMVVGLYLTFYSSHRRISITASGTNISIAALTSKNPIAFKRELEKFIKEAELESSTPVAEESK